ncbi:MAG: hypothetical protein MZW92_38290 [Comamonadaceae bacterium]|nr:hypothetical protein [Comamonadaceae bacterium]
MTALAATIVTRINDALVVNPVNLIAVAMLGAPRRAMDAAHLAQQIDLLKQLLTEVPYSERQVLTEMNGEAVVAYGEGLGHRAAHRPPAGRHHPRSDASRRSCSAISATTCCTPSPCRR